MWYICLALGEGRGFNMSKFNSMVAEQYKITTNFLIKIGLAKLRDSNNRRGTPRLEEIVGITHQELVMKARRWMTYIAARNIERVVSKLFNRNLNLIAEVISNCYEGSYDFISRERREWGAKQCD